MKTNIAKLFKTIFIVIAVILLIITAVLYFMDTPVVEEGQEPTIAQKIILLGKKYLSEILMASGVSIIGIIGIFVKLIYNQVKQTFARSDLTSAEVAELKEENAELRKQITNMVSSITSLTKKQDIANNALLTTFSLSEMPSAVRSQIFTALSDYKAVDNKAESSNAADLPITAVEDIVKNIVASSPTDTTDETPVSPILL